MNSGAGLEFDARCSTIIGVTGWFAFLPVVIAVIFAAPFVLELERGTYRLAWTQSITRRRWLAAKLTIALGGAGLAAAITAALLTWWRRPIEPGAFQLEGSPRSPSPCSPPRRSYGSSSAA